MSACRRILEASSTRVGSFALWRRPTGGVTRGQLAAGVGWRREASTGQYAGIKKKAPRNQAAVAPFRSDSPKVSRVRPQPLIYIDIPTLQAGTVGAYAFAFVCAGLATALRLVIDQYVEGVPYVTFFPAVIIVTLASYALLFFTGLPVSVKELSASPPSSSRSAQQTRIV